MKKIWIKYKEMILYLFFGGCTTLVNIVVYAVTTRWLGMSLIVATIWAWILSVIFAYVTNRKWVFDSKVSSLDGICKEFASFVSCRLFSGALDVFIMWLFASVMGFPDLMIKVLSNIIVIVINYIASKFWIFKK